MRPFVISLLLIVSPMVRGEVRTVDFEAFRGFSYTCGPNITIKSASGAAISGGQILTNNVGFRPVNPT